MKNKYIFKLTLLACLKKLLCTDLLSLTSMPASLVTQLLANRAQIPATGLIEVSPSVHVLVVPSHSVHVPLESLLLPPTLPKLL
jgi:hypothetical protein